MTQGGGGGGRTDHLDALNRGGDRLGRHGGDTRENEVLGEAQGGPRLHTLIASGQTRHGCGAAAYRMAGRRGDEGRKEEKSASDSAAQHECGASFSNQTNGRLRAMQALDEIAHDIKGSSCHSDTHRQCPQRHCDTDTLLFPLQFLSKSAISRRENETRGRCKVCMHGTPCGGCAGTGASSPV